MLLPDKSWKTSVNPENLCGMKGNKSTEREFINTE